MRRTRAQELKVCTLGTDQQGPLSGSAGLLAGNRFLQLENRADPAVMVDFMGLLDGPRGA